MTKMIEVRLWPDEWFPVYEIIRDLEDPEYKGQRIHEVPEGLLKKYIFLQHNFKKALDELDDIVNDSKHHR